MPTRNAKTSSNNPTGAIDTPADETHDRPLDKTHMNELVTRVAMSAHETVDRLAASAVPAVDGIRRGVDQASASVHACADRLDETQKEWTESMRCAVRDYPLAAVATALALGLIVSRLAR